MSDRWGVAKLVKAPDFEGKVSEQTIRHFAAHLIETTGVSRHGVLLQVRFIKALEKTSVGKVNKKAMREANEKALGAKK